jgi:response regulator of citrate/malate metabolism
MKMLIVDDSRMVTDVIGPMIHKQKPELELHTANTFAEAHEFMSQHNNIDYLVTDYYLDKGALGIDLITHCDQTCHPMLISNKDVSERAEDVNAEFLFKSSGWLDKRIIAWMDEIESTQ